MVIKEKKFLKFFLLLTFTILLAGCQKDSINGNLDGRWQILEIENGGKVSQVKDEQLYYSFYLHVCELSFYGGSFTQGNLKYDGRTVWMQFPYIQTTNGKEKLKEYGIFSNPVEFTVEYLDRNVMILKDKDVIINLRKF